MSTNGAIERAVMASLAEHYGLAGSLARLPGENINFLVTTKYEEKFVCKIVDEHMPAEVVSMENELLEHARMAGYGAGLPYIRKTYKQNTETRIKLPLKGLYRLHLMDYVDGTVLEYISNISIKLLKNVGNTMAQFDLAVADFEHVAAHRSHRWDLANADQHREKLALVTDRGQRQLIAWAFDQWAEIRSVLGELPHQVIHGDANPENLLVADEEVIGIVDFGDCCYNPRICELGIALAYLMMEQQDPIEAAEAVVTGYQQVLPLTRQELDVLYPLVCGRLAVTICMATARRREDPENPNWFSSLDPALELLGWLRGHLTGTNTGQSSH